jgi:hypothetical protein
MNAPKVEGWQVSRCDEFGSAVTDPPTGIQVWSSEIRGARGVSAPCLGALAGRLPCCPPLALPVLN